MDTERVRRERRKKLWSRAAWIFMAAYACAVWACAQSSGPISTPAINKAYYFVGTSPYGTTIQSAVTAACNATTHHGIVFVPPGISPTDNPLIQNGCAGVFIQVQTTPSAQVCYEYSTPTAYVVGGTCPGGGGGGGIPTTPTNHLVKINGTNGAASAFTDDGTLAQLTEPFTIVDNRAASAMNMTGSLIITDNGANAYTLGPAQLVLNRTWNNPGPTGTTTNGLVAIQWFTGTDSSTASNPLGAAAFAPIWDGIQSTASSGAHEAVEDDCQIRGTGNVIPQRSDGTAMLRCHNIVPMELDDSAATGTINSDVVGLWIQNIAFTRPAGLTFGGNAIGLYSDWPGTDIVTAAKSYAAQFNGQTLINADGMASSPSTPALRITGALSGGSPRTGYLWQVEDTANGNAIAAAVTGAGLLIGNYGLAAGLTGQFSIAQNGSMLQGASAHFSGATNSFQVDQQSQFTKTAVFDPSTTSSGWLLVPADDLSTNIAFYTTNHANTQIRFQVNDDGSFGTQALAAGGVLAAAVSTGAVGIATGSQISGTLQSLTGCGVSGNVLVPKDNDCVAPSGSPTAFEVNGTPLTSATTVNYQNGTGNGGIAFTNPSAGIVQANLSLPIAGAGPGFTTGPNSGVTAGDLALFTGTGGQLTDGAIAGSAVVTLTGTQTLTNKSISGPQINSGVVSETNGGTGANLSAAAGVVQTTGGTMSASTALASGTTATTQSVNDNTVDVATDQFVQRNRAIQTCADTTGSGTAQVCNTSPTFTPIAGSQIVYTSSTANSGTGLTINVNSLGAKSVAKWQNVTTLAANDLQVNAQVVMTYDGTNWELATIGNAPSGGSVNFSAVGAGTNANALLVGTGGSLGISGSGTIAATTATTATNIAGGGSNEVPYNTAAGTTAFSALFTFNPTTSLLTVQQTGSGVGEGICILNSGAARALNLYHDASGNITIDAANTCTTGSGGRPLSLKATSVIASGPITSALGNAAITSATGGTGITSVTCATAACTVSRGSYTIVGGTATTGTIATLVWPTTTTAWVCSVDQNGGTGFLGIGHGVATATGMTITASVTVIGVTLTADYNCVP